MPFFFAVSTFSILSWCWNSLPIWKYRLVIMGFSGFMPSILWLQQFSYFAFCQKPKERHWQKLKAYLEKSRCFACDEFKEAYYCTYFIWSDLFCKGFHIGRKNAIKTVWKHNQSRIKSSVVCSSWLAMKSYYVQGVVIFTLNYKKIQCIIFHLIWYR